MTICQLSLPSLYTHQEEFVAKLRASIAKHRATIACGVTGFGKSRIAKWVMASAANRPIKDTQSGHSLFTVHRRGLVDNICLRFDESPELEYGVIMSGCDTAPAKRIQVASIDTLLSWYCEEGQYTTDYTYDLIVFDETHSHLSKLKTFLECHNVKRQLLGLDLPYVLGLTATPECTGLSDVYKEIVTGPAPTWLQDNGYASRFRYMTGTKGALEKLKKSGGDFTRKSVADAMDGLAGDFVRDWKQIAQGCPTIGFFPRLSHAREAMEELRAAGVDARYVDGQTPDDERQQLFEGLGVDYEYLCNVGVVERGTDIPRIECVQLCTAVNSKKRLLQMIGRGARVSEGKRWCWVIDHGGSITRLHTLWEDEQQWTLDARTKETSEHGVRPTMECPKCGAVYRGGECMQCGYAPTARERKAQGLTFDGSELTEIKAKPKPAIDPRRLFVECLYRAAYSGKTWKQACGMFKGECRKAGSNHWVPKDCEIGGRQLKAIPYGDEKGNRRVADLFPFLVKHDG